MRVKTNNWMLHYDNAPCHTATPKNEFLAIKHINCAPNRPYPTDLNHSDFFLFTKLKFQLQGRQFEHLKHSNGYNPQTEGCYST